MASAVTSGHHPSSIGWRRDHGARGNRSCSPRRHSRQSLMNAASRTWPISAEASARSPERRLPPGVLRSDRFKLTRELLLYAPELARRGVGQENGWRMLRWAYRHKSSSPGMRPPVPIPLAPSSLRPRTTAQQRSSSPHKLRHRRGRPTTRAEPTATAREGTQLRRSRPSASSARGVSPIPVPLSRHHLRMHADRLRRSRCTAASRAPGRPAE